MIDDMVDTAGTLCQAAEILKEKESLLSIEDRIAPVSEVFRLQGAAELQEAEKLQSELINYLI